MTTELKTPLSQLPTAIIRSILQDSRASNRQPPTVVILGIKGNVIRYYRPADHLYPAASSLQY